MFDPDFKFPIGNIAPIESAWAEIGGIVNFANLADDKLFDDTPRQTALAA